MIIVDDGSKDQTSSIVSSLLNDHRMNLRLLKLEKNQGKGGAVKQVSFG